VGEEESVEAWPQRLRRARNRLGLSRKEAAKRAGLSEGLWRNVETGVQHIAGVGARPYTTTANTVARMAAVVRLDPLDAVRAAGLDPADVHLDSAAEANSPEVRIIMVRGGSSTDEVLDEVRRVLGDMGQ